MTYFFYICVSICLVIFQTTVIPCLPLFDRFYDLLIPFIVYLGLFRPVRESLPVIFFLGFIMDNLSGGPFGLYATIYFWLFIGVRWSIKFLHTGNTVFLLFIASGVLIENFIVIGATSILKPGLRLPAAGISTVAVQVLLAICTGLFLLMFFNYTHKKLNKWFDELFAKRNGHGW